MTIIEIKAERKNVSDRIRGYERTKASQKKTLTEYLKGAEELSQAIRATDEKISAAYKEYEKLGQQWRELDT